jgi:hypothetical protein
MSKRIRNDFAKVNIKKDTKGMPFVFLPNSCGVFLALASGASGFIRHPGNDLHWRILVTIEYFIMTSNFQISILPPAVMKKI